MSRLGVAVVGEGESDHNIRRELFYFKYLGHCVIPLAM